MKISKIERYGLADRVLELSLTKTTREMAEIIKAEKGVDISHKAIAVWLKGTRQERREQTKAVVEEHIKATVPKDLELLDAIIDDLRQIYFSEKSTVVYDANNEPHEVKGLELVNKLPVAREIRHAVATKLRFSGAGEGSGGGALEEALDSLDDDAGSDSDSG